MSVFYRIPNDVIPADTRRNTRFQGTKRKECADLDYEDTPVSTAKKPKAAIQPRQPSNRATRVPKRADSIEPIANLGPAGPDLPRHKRPAGSKAADAAEAATQAAARAEERDAILARLAALNAVEDEQREAEQQAFIDSLEDLPMPPAEDETSPILTITADHFERLEDDEAYYSVSEYEKPKAKAPKKAKKPGKRETRAAVEETTKALAAAQAMEKKKNGRDSNAATSSAKAGLSQTWKASVSSKVANASTPESPKLGGLEDEDARAERPQNATGHKAVFASNIWATAHGMLQAT
ncbi:hypothetical protein GGX14DRAFT_386842 [Mycena pura]|uniref:Uncharacterized protein n=1 Tax=Mycena pura TaxID=153505 RepID=A0AAD6YMJ6_9AGAR|nr:hypothetical protein GGX14DRAFT_386842 [Mycena pura]